VDKSSVSVAVEVGYRLRDAFVEASEPNPLDETLLKTRSLNEVQRTRVDN
jgi:hypothetical protein